MRLGILCVSNRTLLHMIGFLNSLMTPPLRDLINYQTNLPFILTMFLPLHHVESQTSLMIFSPEEAR